MGLLRFLWIIVPVVMMSKAANARPEKATLVIEEIKINKDSISLVNTISNDSLKLVQLQSQVEEKTKEKEATAIEAQRIADENNKAAKLLSKDPLKKKIARRADKLSSEARQSAKKARIAANALTSLNKSIASLQKKMLKDQAKLDKIRNILT